MLTRCPNCHTLFRISDGQLRSARGKTRCGQCFTIFEAQEESSESNAASIAAPAPHTPSLPISQPAPAQPTPRLPTLKTRKRPSIAKTPNRDKNMGNAASSIYNELVIKNRSLKYDIPENIDSDPANADPVNSNPVSYDPAPAPSYQAVTPVEQEQPELSTPFNDFSTSPAEKESITPITKQSLTTTLSQKIRSNLRNPLQKRSEATNLNLIPDVLHDDLYEEVHISSGKSNILIITTVIILLLALVLQFVYFMRHSLAENNAIIPVLVKFCEKVGCDVPYKKNVKKIKMVTFTYDIHPKNKNIGVINSRFVNDAPYTQPYPVVVLKVRSKVNKLIAMRRVQPKDYLPKDKDIKKGFEPNSTIDLKIVFEIPTKEPPSVFLSFK